MTLFALLYQNLEQQHDFIVFLMNGSIKLLIQDDPSA